MSTEHHIVVLDSGPTGNDVSWAAFEKIGKFTCYENTKPEEAASRMADATIVLTNKVAITAELINASPKLAYIGAIATGYNQIDTAAAKARNIPVCNLPDYSSPTVAQHTMGLILSLACGITAHDKAVKEGQWSRAPYFCFWNQPLMELAGKTLGIVGFGSIGSAVARLGHAFGMRVVAYAPRPKQAPEYTPFEFVSLEELFRQSDVVSLHCYLTPENTGFVNTALLQTMKKNALIINTSRGPLINATDLAAALQAGTIAGAGLDVVEVEPMPNDNPLLQAPNCIITPHIAWATIETRTRLLDGVRKNIENFIKGSPTNVVNGV